MNTPIIEKLPKIVSELRYEANIKDIHNPRTSDLCRRAARYILNLEESYKRMANSKGRKDSKRLDKLEALGRNEGSQNTGRYEWDATLDIRTAIDSHPDDDYRLT